MRCLGLIGGIGWESTAIYYRLLNQRIQQRFGGLHTPPLLLHSLEFHVLQALVREGRWHEVAGLLGHVAQTLERAGAGAVLVCSNQMHYVADRIEAGLTVPFLHVGDAIVEALRAERIKRVGLLGTRFTLEQGFLLRRKPAGRQGMLQIETPDPADQGRLERIIFSELCQGLVRESSREEVLLMIRLLRDRNVQAIVLASSELATLLRPEDFAGPIFDSTELHCAAAVRWMLDEDTPRVDLTRTTLTAEPGGRVIKRSHLSPLKLVRHP